MKSNVFSFAIVLFFPLATFAQSFSEKTNDIELDFNLPNKRTVLPLIWWNSPQPEYTAMQGSRIDIDVIIRSEIVLTRLVVKVGSGSILRGEKSVLTGPLNEYRIRQPVFLQNGPNFIEILAENTLGGIVSSVRTVEVGKEGVLAADRKDYALLFATDQYDSWNDLVNPVDDARSIALILREKYNFSVEIVENPNTDDVFNKLRDYAEKKFKPQDQLLIFFAGHGYFDETFGEGFVVARNSLQNDKAKTTYISHSRLRQIINNIPSPHVLLTMDVCFGGTIDPMIATDRGPGKPIGSELDEFLIRKLSQKTRKYFTSGGKTYVSDGIPGKHSPFTLKLLEALSTGGGSDHVLTLSEMKTYVEKLKPEPRMGGFGDDKVESDFIFLANNFR